MESASPQSPSEVTYEVYNTLTPPSTLLETFETPLKIYFDSQEPTLYDPTLSSRLTFAWDWEDG